MVGVDIRREDIGGVETGVEFDRGLYKI